MLRDYYVSATVKPINLAESGWSLWTERIEAQSLPDARSAALALMASQDFICGSLDILWDEYPAKSADAILMVKS